MPEINLEYTPRKQFIDFHMRKERWATLVCHRRAGKTVACIHELVARAIECDLPNPRFIYLAPFFRQSKDIAWQILKDIVRPFGDIVKINESELRVDIGDKRIRLYGADNYDALRGIYADGIVLDEYGDMDPRAWPEVIRPALADRRGWAVFIGTPKGENDFFEKYEDAVEDPDWYSSILKASETDIIEKTELVEMRKSMSREQYNQELECSFQAAIVGSYYGTDIELAASEGRICGVPMESELEVHTSWDLGVADSTVIWAYQLVGKEIHIINHYEASGEGLGHYAKVLSKWRDELNYNFGSHFLPHDVKVRELGTGRSREETLRELGIKIKMVPNLGVEDGINAVRRILSRCWFDKERTAQGMRALRQYRTEYDERRKTFRNNPLHDWASHSSDAFRYLAVSLQDKSKSQPLKYDNSGII